MFSKKSVVVGWACSYIIILSIPIIAIFINYYFNVKVIEREIVRANEQILANLQECVDDYLEDGMSLYQHIFLDESINNMMRKKKIDQNFYYNTYVFLNNMGNYTRYNPDLLSCVYFGGKDYVLDLKGGGSSEQLYDSMEYAGRFREITLEDWREIIGGYYNNEFLVTDKIYRDTSEKCLVYADTIEYFSISSANVFVGIPISKIEALVSRDDVSFIIAAEGQDILWISGENEAQSLDSIQYISDEEVMIAGERYVCLVEESTVPKVTFKLLINSKEFWKEAQHTRNFLFISIAMVMALGCVCVVFLLRRNMQPLLAVLKKIGGEEGKGNEYAQIESLYESLIEKNTFMHNKILNQNELIERNKLLALLKGRNVDISEDRGFVLGENECVHLVGLKVPMSDKNMIEHDELLYFVINNVFTELMKGEKFCKVEDGQYLFYMFAVESEKTESWKSECVKKVDYLCDFIKDKCEISLGATVSGTYGQRLEEVRFLYRDIMETFGFQEQTGQKGMVDKGEILSNYTSMYEQEEIFQNKIADSVKKYVEENYADSALNIKTMAACLGWNPKYISRVFREQEGVGILEHINNVRIEHSLLLLISGSYSIEEVSEKVGYASSKTFRQAFAKKMGVAPSKYKGE